MKCLKKQGFAAAATFGGHVAAGADGYEKGGNKTGICSCRRREQKKERERGHKASSGEILETQSNNL